MVTGTAWMVCMRFTLRLNRIIKKCCHAEDDRTGRAQAREAEEAEAAIWGGGGEMGIALEEILPLE